MGVYVSNDEVEDFMSTPVVRDTYDDDNDGLIDAPSLSLIVDISEALFNGTLRGIYVLPLVPPLDPLGKHIVLQLVHCQSIRRFPERFRNGLKICENVAALLKDIRDGKLVLDHPKLNVSGSTGIQVCSLPPRGYEALEMTSDEDDFF